MPALFKPLFYWSSEMKLIDILKEIQNEIKKHKNLIQPNENYKY